MFESIESSKFVSHKARISEEFDSRKVSYPKKLDQRPQTFVKLSFRELLNSRWPERVNSDFMIIFDVIVLTLTQNSPVMTNDTQVPLEYPHQKT